MLDRLSSPGQEWHASIQFCYWLQYHLHKQLQQASQYAGHKHVALKGDLPIGALRCHFDLCQTEMYSPYPSIHSPAVAAAAGVDKCSVDTWLSPNLFRMDVSTGAATAVCIAFAAQPALPVGPAANTHSLVPSCCRRPSRLL